MRRATLYKWPTVSGLWIIKFAVPFIVSVSLGFGFIMTNEKDFESYFKDIHREFKQGQKTELTFRSYLKTFVESLFPELNLSEENKQIRKVGRPDFTCFKKGNIKVGYVETKHIYHKKAPNSVFHGT